MRPHVGLVLGAGGTVGAAYHAGVLFSIEHHTDGPWPTDDLKVCAVSAGDGGLRVLGASSDVDLSTAVAASCAVPGLFRPQRVHGEHLVDGGVRSVTNVDALDFSSTTHPIEEVWIVAPMAGATFRGVSTALLRRRIEMSLRQELAAVPIGMPVRLFTPGRESSEVMGVDLMSDDRAASVILAGFLEAGSPQPVAS